MIYWGSAPGAASAGLLTGIIVFVLVPLLGLLAYILVFLRRTRCAGETLPHGAPGCAPPAGAVAPILLRCARALPALRLLPLFGLSTLGATFTASTPMTVLLQSQEYWRNRATYTGAVVPFISDTGADDPSWFVFACGLCASAALLLAAFRLVYERMDPVLAALDAAQGRYGRQGEALLCGCDDGDSKSRDAAPAGELQAPQQAPGMAAEDADAAADAPTADGAAAFKPCWCSSGRYLHCCCCCAQSLRQQGRAAYICAAAACAGLPLLGWSSVRVQVFVHSLGATATFLCVFLHMALLARLAAARVNAAARGVGGITITAADARSARVKAACLWAVPIGALLAFLIVLPACGARAGEIWSAYLAAVLEWAYAGVLAVYTLSLCHEAGLPEAAPPASPRIVLADEAGAPFRADGAEPDTQSAK